MIRTPRHNLSLDEAFALVKPGTLIQPTDFINALDVCTALRILLGGMLAEDVAGAVITLFDGLGQPITWLGTNIKAGPDPAWDRLCLANLSKDGTYDPDTLLNSNIGPWVVVACRHPSGSIKHNLAPVFERVYCVQRKG